MRIGACVVLAALALPVPLAAQMGPSHSGRAALAQFRNFDRDGDRALSRAELLVRGREKGAEAMFVMLDADGDGRLALKEVEGAGGGGRVARFDAYDVNKDGFVARREFPNFPDPRLIAALDRNRDNRLALGEIRPAFAGFRPRMEKAAAQPVKSRPAAAPVTKAWCWVPAFGDDGWGLEAPVLWSACRTTASR